MKSIWICLPLAIALALSSCQPIQQGGGDGPKPVLRAGHFARTLIDNTSFFRQIPLAGGQADLLLQRHTTMKVIQIDPGYCRVELDSGEIGFVMTAMIEPIPVKVPERPVDEPIDGPTIIEPIDPDPPVGPGVPDLLPPTIDPEP